MVFPPLIFLLCLLNPSLFLLQQPHCEQPQVRLCPVGRDMTVAKARQWGWVPTSPISLPSGLP